MLPHSFLNCNTAAILQHGPRLEAAPQAVKLVDRAAVERRRAVEGEPQGTEYEASLAARRYELVDPAEWQVARELEPRWDAALKRVEQIKQLLVGLDGEWASHPAIDRTALIDLARDLPRCGMGRRPARARSSV